MKTNIKSVNNLILVSITIILLSLIGCKSNNKETIRVSGSSTVLPVISKAAEQFLLKNSNVNIIVNSGGSGVGINLLGGKQIEIAMSSRDITQKEIDSSPEVEFLIHTIAKDAVVPVISSEVFDSGIKSLSLEQIGKIYKGEVKNWKELGGTDKEILVIDKETSRGTRHIFMKIVLGNKEAKAPGADLVLGSNNEEQTAIVQSDAAIGMLSNAWLNKDVKGLSIILESGETVEPTIENIVNGTFPIKRDLLLITNGEPKGITKTFIDFVNSAEGQKIVTEVGYVSMDR